MNNAILKAGNKPTIGTKIEGNDAAIFLFLKIIN
jgi:hypothetical protein